jgi:hypothetical protein
VGTLVLVAAVVAIIIALVELLRGQTAVSAFAALILGVIVLAVHFT